MFLHMSGLEVNKIIAAIIMVILIIFIINNVGDTIVNIDKEKQGKSADEARTVAIADSLDSEKNNSEQTNKLESIEQISPLLISASLEKGEKLFKKCGSCHNYKKDGANKIGPNLWDIINRTKASSEGFAYSTALSSSGGEWTYEELAKFLYKPKDYVKGTKMNFSGLKKVEDRANIVFFLREQSDNPVPLP